MSLLRLNPELLASRLELLARPFEMVLLKPGATFRQCFQLSQLGFGRCTLFFECLQVSSQPPLLLVTFAFEFSAYRASQFVNLLLRATTFLVKLFPATAQRCFRFRLLGVPLINGLLKPLAIKVELLRVPAAALPKSTPSRFGIRLFVRCFKLLAFGVL